MTGAIAMTSSFLRITTLATGLGLGTTACAAPTQWSHEDPDGWAEANPDFALCEAGLMQSPIDLEAAYAVGDLELSVDWQAGTATVSDLGKTGQVDFPQGSYMTSGGTVFRLVQVHFHTPSEHTFSGETAPLVAHFVHATDAGELGVLGVLFDSGEPNPGLVGLVDALGDVEAGGEGVTLELDPNAMLPGELEVYRYMGSLTTPPCSEGVHWHVAETMVEASPEQIAALEARMGMNARPTLPLNGRLLVAPD
jgi:carbonic anhydrase